MCDLLILYLICFCNFSEKLFHNNILYRQLKIFFSAFRTYIHLNTTDMVYDTTARLHRQKRTLTDVWCVESQQVDNNNNNNI